MPESATIAEFRAKVPLGSTSRVLLAGPEREYCGIVETARAYDPALDPEAPVASIAQLEEDAIPPAPTSRRSSTASSSSAPKTSRLSTGAGRILGVVTEKYAHRRYIEESEKAQSALFGES